MDSKEASQQDRLLTTMPALDLEEGQFRQLVEHSLVGIYIIQDDRFIYVNPKLAEIFRTTQKELVSRELSQLVSPQDWPNTRQKINQRISGEIAKAHYVVDLLRKDGSLVHAEVHGERMEYKGRPAIMGTLVDITERRQVELELHTSESRFREMLENVDIIAVTLDESADITFCNDYLLEITGWTRREVMGRNWFECFIPDSFMTQMKAIYFETLGTPDFPAHFENPIKTKTGELRQIRWNNTVLRNPNKEVIGVACLGEDITAKLALEEQLRQAQKLEAIGTLAGGIAHDFNNILGTIKGFTELAKMDAAGNPGVVEHLNEILLAGNRAGDLVQQILTFSRKQDQHLQTLRLQDIVDDAVRLLRSTIPSTIEFVIKYGQDAFPIYADTTQIHQIVMNLGTNAWHAMTGVSGTLSITVDGVESPLVSAADLPRGKYTCLTVSDTGTGMDKELLSRIFDPFFTTKPPGSGTGLGLSVVHGIMESYRGVVRVESKVGVGTVFKLYFPAHIDSIPVPVSTPKETRLRLGSGERILIVDDEPTIADLTGKILNRTGFAAKVVTSSTEAFNLILANPKGYSLLITDLSMPKLTGIQLSEKVHSINSSLPIILTTGNSDLLVEDEMKSLGILDVLRKPVSRERLCESVHRVLASTNKD